MIPSIHLDALHIFYRKSCRRAGLFCGVLGRSRRLCHAVFQLYRSHMPQRY